MTIRLQTYVWWNAESAAEVSSNPKSIWLMKCISFTEIAIRFNRISSLSLPFSVVFSCWCVFLFEHLRHVDHQMSMIFVCPLFIFRSLLFLQLIVIDCLVLNADENGHQNDERIIYAISTAIFGIYFLFFFFGRILYAFCTQLLR